MFAFLLAGRNIAVIGAGVAGLAAAAALAQRGAKVTVYERAEALRLEGAGIQIAPNGAAVLAALGVPVNGLETRAIRLRDYAQGREIVSLDLSARRWSHPFLLFARGALIAALAEAATRAGVGFEFGRAVSADALDAGLVIGAEGIHSTTRRALNPEAAAFFTGQVAWRAIIQSDGPPEVDVFMGPGRHLVTYPVGQKLRNIVAVEERESWAEEGWDHEDDPSNLCAAFEGFSDEVQAWLRDVTSVKLWGLFRHEIARNWHDGRRVIIGDAAHPTLPFLAQGANLALEDAWLLAAHVDQNSDLVDGLDAFTRRRVPRVTRAIRAANSNARLYHLRSPFSRHVAHFGIGMGEKLRPGFSLRRFDWLYGYDPTAAG